MYESLEEKKEKIDLEIAEYISKIPNIMHKSVPIGKDETKNKVRYKRKLIQVPHLIWNNIPKWKHVYRWKIWSIKYLPPEKAIWEYLKGFA